MASLRSSPFIFLLCFWVSLISSAFSQTCSTQKFTGNNLYAHCVDLPTLTSYLHFSYDSSNSTLSIAFLASPPASDGWVSWAINPTGTGMAGAQALVGYKDSKGSMTVKTYNISSYTLASVVQSTLAFEVWDQRAEEDNGVFRIFAKMKVPADLAATGSVNQVWQVGSSVDSKGVLTPHDMSAANLNAKGTLDLKGGQSVATGGVDSKTKKRNVSWLSSLSLSLSLSPASSTFLITITVYSENLYIKYL